MDVIYFVPCFRLTCLLKCCPTNVVPEFENGLRLSSTKRMTENVHSLYYVFDNRVTLDHLAKKVKLELLDPR